MIKKNYPYRYFPNDKEDLSIAIESCAEWYEIFDHKRKTKKKIKSKPKIIIAPHGSYSSTQAGIVYHHAYLDLPKKSKNIILLGNSHYYDFKYCLYQQNPNFTPFGSISTNLSLLEQIKHEPYITMSNEIHQIEHCLLNQFPWIQKKEIYSILPLLISKDFQEYQNLSSNIAKMIKNEGVLISTTDLTHCGYKQKEKKAYGLKDNIIEPKNLINQMIEQDSKLIQAIQNLNTKYLKSINPYKIHMCGIQSTIVALEVAKKLNLEMYDYSYFAGGDSNQQMTGFTSIKFH